MLNSEMLILWLCFACRVLRTVVSSFSVAMALATKLITSRLKCVGGLLGLLASDTKLVLVRTRQLQLG